MARISSNEINEGKFVVWMNPGMLEAGGNPGQWSRCGIAWRPAPMHSITLRFIAATQWKASSTHVAWMKRSVIRANGCDAQSPGVRHCNPRLPPSSITLGFIAATSCSPHKLCHRHPPQTPNPGLSIPSGYSGELTNAANRRHARRGRVSPG